MRHATIALPEDLAELVESEARRRQTTTSEVVRQLIVQGLATPTPAPGELPWAGLFDDPHMAPGERMEEILMGRWADDIHRDRG